MYNVKETRYITKRSLALNIIIASPAFQTLTIMDLLLLLGSNPQQTREFAAIKDFCTANNVRYKCASEGRDWVTLRLPEQSYQELHDWLRSQGYEKSVNEADTTFTAPSQQ
jgi:hypothetical protein